MSQEGTDTNPGTSEGRAVFTLERIHEILQNTQPATDVVVLVHAGTYRCAGMQGWWTYQNERD